MAFRDGQNVCLCSYQSRDLKLSRGGNSENVDVSSLGELGEL